MLALLISLVLLGGIAALVVSALVLPVIKPLKIRPPPGAKAFHEIPSPPRSSWLMGNTDVALPFYNLFQKFVPLQRQYGDLVRLRIANTHLVIIQDPEAIQHVFSHRHLTSIRDPPAVTILEAVTGKSIFVLDSRDPAWKTKRRLANPAFHHDSLTKYAATMIDCCDTFLERIETIPPKNGSVEIDVGSWMQRLTMDIIGLTGFGYDIGMLKDESAPVGAAINFVLNHFMKIVRSPLPPKIRLALPTRESREFHAASKLIRDLVQDIIRNARKDIESGGLPSATSKNIMTNLLLLNAKDVQTGEPLTDKDMQDEVMTFFIAGHETTSRLMTYALYEIANRPDVEAKLFEEIQAYCCCNGGDNNGGDNNGNNARPTPEIVNKMIYLNGVVKETLRMYPPAYVVGRTNDADDLVLKGYHIPKGIFFFAAIYGVHHRADYWEDPHEFRPERFLKENEHKITPGTWLPFGAGPKFCIGQSFALMEAKLLLARILQFYKPKLVPGQRPLSELLYSSFTLGLAPEHKLNLMMEKRG